jgi:hypothetical protein
MIQSIKGLVFQKRSWSMEIALWQCYAKEYNESKEMVGIIQSIQIITKNSLIIKRLIIITTIMKKDVNNLI